MKNQALYRRLAHACFGILKTWQSEASFRSHSLCLLLLLPVLIIVQAEPLWWALLLLAAGTVLTAELLNTAIENMMDLLHPQQHAVVKLVKDGAAGAVLLASIMALGVFIAFSIAHF